MLNFTPIQNSETAVCKNTHKEEAQSWSEGKESQSIGKPQFRGWAERQGWLTVWFDSSTGRSGRPFSLGSSPSQRSLGNKISRMLECGTQQSGGKHGSIEVN